MKPSRRRLIQVGLGGSVVLALGGLGLALRPTVMRQARGSLQVLDPRSFSILVAICDRITPGGDGFPTAAELQVAERVDALLAGLHPADQADFVRALALVENALAGALLDGRFTAFTACGPTQQDAVLEAFRASSLAVRRTVFRALFGLCSSAYWANPAINLSCGYPGPPDYGNGKGSEPSRPPIKRRPIEPPGPLHRGDDDDSAGARVRGARP